MSTGSNNPTDSKLSVMRNFTPNCGSGSPPVLDFRAQVAALSFSSNYPAHHSSSFPLKLTPGAHQQQKSPFQPKPAEGIMLRALATPNLQI
mmetsp:Transcript_56878/g.94366  ORF Transcript_56878/g.94366 Transcript_56878/m.94366 type:complete len:91 (+) Transcript_56878:123-395(+)